MEPIDPVAFGRRVRERRDELGMSQADLAKESGYSQSNITWFETGGPKKPKRAAGALAEALQTTPEWLLYERGPKQVGPRFLPAARVKEKYETLTAEQKAFISQYLEDSEQRQAPGRTG